MSEPRKGIHSLRDPLFDYAIVDLAGTALVSYGFSKWTNWSFLASFAVVFSAGQAAHYALGVNTKFMNDVGVDLDTSKLKGNVFEEKQCPFVRDL